MDYKVTIRNVDRELIKLARIDAIRKGITLGDWLNRLIAKELRLRKGKK